MSTEWLQGQNSSCVDIQAPIIIPVIWVTDIDNNFITIKYSCYALPSRSLTALPQ